MEPDKRVEMLFELQLDSLMKDFLSCFKVFPKILDELQLKARVVQELENHDRISLGDILAPLL